MFNRKIDLQMVHVECRMFILPEINGSPLKIDEKWVVPKGNVIFQPSIFRCNSLVSGRIDWSTDGKIMAQQNHPPTLRQSLNTQKSFNLPCFFHWTLALRFVDSQALNPTFLCWHLFGSPFCLDLHQLFWQFWKKKQFQMVAFCRIWPTFALNKLAREGDKRVNIKSDISSPQSDTYCWRKKSCTTWDLQNPVNKGINYPSTGAGF